LGATLDKGDGLVSHLQLVELCTPQMPAEMEQWGTAGRQAARRTAQSPQDLVDGIGMARVPNLQGGLV